MSLFAIGDLHLSGGGDKPMDIFGVQWDRHFFHIAEHWHASVREEDTVLIPGDISWAMRLEDAGTDLRAIGELPGKKIICKGNHDYWWNSISRVRSILPPGMYALQHDAVIAEDCVVCGTRGWLIPSETAPLAETDQKLYLREVQRLRMALQEAGRIGRGLPIIVMTHYPPIHRGSPRSLFSDTLEEWNVRAVVYGHLHGDGIGMGITGERNGVFYQLVSCDSVGFAPQPVRLAEKRRDTV